MRTLPNIRSLWESGGPFIGDDKPTTRVTVQDPFPNHVGTNRENDILFTTRSFGPDGGRTIYSRWYQNKANDHEFTELENILSVNIDRTIDQDAGQVRISISNQKMYDNDSTPTSADSAGQPGFYSPERGESPEGNARWGTSENSWRDKLVPNALLRVYTGFGGGDLTTYPSPLDAVAADKLALYGVFLVDEVVINSQGGMEITGRDMAKLLIDQQIYPPLLPSSKYPLSYRRWRLESFNVQMAPKNITSSATIPSSGSLSSGTKSIEYETSSADKWFGYNASIFGHVATDSIDGKAETYALSVGNSHSSRPFTTDYWQYLCGEDMNAVHLHPWAGGYILYVSVDEGSGWVSHPNPPADDGGVVPYDSSELFSSQSPAVDTGADIPYVAKFRVPHEEARDYVLDRVYSAERVRISFRDHYYSGLGTWKYRVGVREVSFKGVNASGTGTSSTSEPVQEEDKEDTSSADTVTTVEQPFVRAAGAIRDPDKFYSQGYLTVSVFDQSDAFGDARILDPSNYVGEELDPTSVRFLPDASGYYVLSVDGKVRAHGDAVWHGDFFDDGGSGSDFIWDMAITETGDGYWLLGTNGVVYSYGDATDFGVSITVDASAGLDTSSIESHPKEHGFWILRTDGKVFNFGAARHWGDYPEVHVFTGTGFASASERAQCIRTTSTGNGYWILTSNGGVGNFGFTKAFGGPERVDHSENIFTQSYWELLPSPTNDGYLLLHASGRVETFGDGLGSIENFGGPVVGGQGQLRYDGNMKDYSDVIQDLVLWSGFLFHDTNGNTDTPVYGTIETTGAWPDEMPADVFDKVPVIDAINVIKEAIGYVVMVDEEGRFVFQSPNFFKIGNYDETGFHVADLPELDERTNLINYTTSRSGDLYRTLITVSSHDPRERTDTTVTTTRRSHTYDKLKGMLKPVLYFNDFFMDPVEQEIMTELIDLHIAFRQREAQATCVAAPFLQLNDQIRVYERVTGTTHVYYIRGINFTHNLQTGNYTMNLSMHWLAAGRDSGDIVGGEVFGSSEELESRINSQYGKNFRDHGGTV